MKFHAPIHGDAVLPLPLMLGHFLPWYTIRGSDFPLPAEEARSLDLVPVISDLRHWQDNPQGYRRCHQHVPAIGVYDSRDPKVIEWQIRTALDYGLSGFIINWYGKNSVENVITLHWLRGMRQWNRANPDRPFFYFISFDSQAQRPTEGKRPVSLEADFAYIRDNLITDAYLRRDGHPVFSVFPYEDNCPAWRQALDKVLGAGQADLIWMNACPGQGENAAYPWVRPDDEAMDYQRMYPWNDPDNAGDNWLRQFYAQAPAQSVSYFMAGVWPGFNDQLVRWAWSENPDDPKIRPRVMGRETSRGNTLELTWQACLEYLEKWRRGVPAARVPMPLIQLVTWNDYAETTTVEPTKDYGPAPLKMCGKYLQEAREIWGKG